MNWIVVREMESQCAIAERWSCTLTFHVPHHDPIHQRTRDAEFSACSAAQACRAGRKLCIACALMNWIVVRDMESQCATPAFCNCTLTFHFPHHDPIHKLTRDAEFSACSAGLSRRAGRKLCIACALMNWIVVRDMESQCAIAERWSC